MPLLDGLVCQVLLLTAATYGTLNDITVEFATPSSVAPTSQLFCFNDTQFQVSSVVLRSLRGGGSQFTPMAQQVGGLAGPRAAMHAPNSHGHTHRRAVA